MHINSVLNTYFCMVKVRTFIACETEPLEVLKIIPPKISTCSIISLLI